MRYIEDYDTWHYQTRPQKKEVEKFFPNYARVPKEIKRTKKKPR